MRLALSELTLNTIGLCVRIVMIASVVVLTPSNFLLAQCDPGDRLIGEDEHYWYCAHESGFPPRAAKLQFALDAAARRVNPKKSLDPKSQDLNCSAFFRELGRQIEATGEEWTAATIRDSRGKKSPVQANQIAEMIRKNPSEWQPVSGTESVVTRDVQSRANEGMVVVGVWEGPEHGHLAVASPMPPNVPLEKFCCRGPMVRDGNVHLSSGKKKPAGWGAVRAGFAFNDYSGDPPKWYLFRPSAQ